MIDPVKFASRVPLRQRIIRNVSEMGSIVGKTPAANVHQSAAYDLQ
jgi:hypothetical protein